MNTINELINKYWRFDNNQQHLSTWHDKQDLLQALEHLQPSQNSNLFPVSQCGDLDNPVQPEPTTTTPNAQTKT